MKLFFRTSVIIVCLIFFSISTLPYAQAQSLQNTAASYTTPETNPDVPHNLHSLTQIVTVEVLSTISC